MQQPVPKAGQIATPLFNNENIPSTNTCMCVLCKIINVKGDI